MSSMRLFVSLCVIRIETVEPESEESASGMASRKGQDRREPRDITVESYTNVSERPLPLLPCSKGFNKSQQPPRSSTEENPKNSSSQTANVEEGATASKPPDQINFISGNPFVEVTKGILHLYKEDEMTEAKLATDRSNTICILSVPATMTCHDLLMFTAACHQDIQYFRIIRDNSPNQYMGLITFRSSAAANEFYETFNGAQYNSLEPDVVCHLVFVSKVEVSNNGLPLAGHTELPSCPVCLERMDESVDGILTILCNHTFHSGCLVKWGDTSCPVCRYAQTPEPLADSHCMECGTSSDTLWICLICGHVGCSRYHERHAFKHYQETHHCYAMQLGNNRVWDYVGDNFVHRLLQDKEGKLVEGGQEPMKSEGAALDEKVDSIQLEVTYLLTSQLETQRQYFEEKLNRLDQRSTSELAELREKLNNISDENSQFKDKISNGAKEKQALEKKLHTLTNKLSQLQSELSEEKELRKALQLNQTSWQTKHKSLQDEMKSYKEAKEAEISDLKEQVRDLMFFLEAQKQIEQSEEKEEIASGRIVIGPSATETKSSSKGRKKHK